MRRNFAAISVALLGILLLPQANAAIKAGSACSKIGATAVFADKKFKCVRSGKKLLWKLDTSTTKPNLLETKSTEPTPVAPSVYEPTVPTSFEDMSQNLSGIIYSAWLKGSNSIKNNQFSLDNIHLIQGPNTSLNEQDSNYQNAISAVQKIFSSLPQSKNVYLIYYSQKDIDWAQTQFEKYMNAYYGYGKRSSAAKDNCPKPNCNGGMAVHTSNFDSIILMGDNNGWVWDEYSPSQGLLGHVFAHEYAHTIQLVSMNPNWGNFPSWLTEGAAEWAATIAIANESYSSYTNFRSKAVLGMQYGNASTYNKEYITKFLNTDQTFEQNENLSSYTRNFPHWDSYSLGLMTCEALVSLKDQNVLIKLLQDINHGMTFPQAIEAEFGITWSKAAPLIVNAISAEIQGNIKS